MTDLVRRFRGLAVALVVLAVSAGAVFAATPRLPSNAAAPAGAHAPAALPAQADENAALPAQADENADEDVQADEDTDTEDGSATEGTHGALVSEAAQMDTPAGFENHGAFVSCVARMDQSATSATVNLSTLTPADCPSSPSADAKSKGDAGKAKASTKSKGHSNAAGKAAVDLPAPAAGRP